MADEYTVLINDNYDSANMKRITGIFIALGIVITVVVMILIATLIKNN